MIYLSDVFNKESINYKHKYPKIIKSFIYHYILLFKVFYIKEVEEITIIYLLKNKSKKLIKYLNDNKIDNICLTNNLYENKEINNLLMRNNKNIINGRWLYRYLTIKILDYIYGETNKKIENEEIAILTNNDDDIAIGIIYELIDKAKLINIITNNRNKYKNLEKKLYEKNGIIINITNNYRKSLKNINTIINLDFTEAEFKKYNISKYAIIINLKNKIERLSKSFEGIIINDYKIFIPKKYLKLIKYLNNFDQTLLYESFIYQRNNYDNIVKIINNDKIKISSLISNYGYIKKNEYERIMKNYKNHLTKFK